MLQNNKPDISPDYIKSFKKAADSKYSTNGSENNDEHYKVRQRKSFKLSDSTFSTFSANLENADD